MFSTSLRGWSLAATLLVLVSALPIIWLGTGSEPPLLLVILTGFALVAVGIGMWKGSRLAWEVMPVVIAGAALATIGLGIASVTAGCSEPPCVNSPLLPFTVAAAAIVGVLVMGLIRWHVKSDGRRIGPPVRVVAVGALWMVSAGLIAYAVFGTTGERGLLDYGALAAGIGLGVVAIAWARGSQVARWTAGIASVAGILATGCMTVILGISTCAVAMLPAPGQPVEQMLGNGGAEGCGIAPIFWILLGGTGLLLVTILIVVLIPESRTERKAPPEPAV